MNKDILIGAVDGYNWQQIKPWVVSAKDSGFEGEIWLITYRIDGVEEMGCALRDHGVNVYQVGAIPSRPGVPSTSHNQRFYDAWELLYRLNPDNYRFAIMTDVRDVIFQRNPIPWLKGVIAPGAVIAASEGIKFKDEEWNRTNLINGFGERFYSVVGADDWKAYNVGTLAGYAQPLCKLFLEIYEMTHRNYYPSDQSAFNVLVNYLARDVCYPMSMLAPWAAQLGTTHDPTKPWLWERLVDPRPTIVMPEGKVITREGAEYAIIHQWDRVPELKALYSKRYA